MANFIYDKAREKFLNGAMSWGSDNFRAVAVSATYTPNQANEFRDSLAGAELAETANLANKTFEDGVADADDAVLPTVPQGTDVAALEIYRVVGSAATDDLVAHIDQAGASLPFTPSGANVDIIWPSGADKIFKL